MVNRRTAAKLIRFHPAELSLVAEHARVCGLTPARFIRETALGGIPRAKRHADTAPLLRELALIGRDLAQLARAGRERGDTPEAERLAAALDALLAAARRVGSR
jgi:citrate lyase beta subunit